MSAKDYDKESFLKSLYGQQQAIPMRPIADIDRQVNEKTSAREVAPNQVEIDTFQVGGNYSAQQKPAPSLDNLIKEKEMQQMQKQSEVNRAPASDNNWMADAMTAASPALVSFLVGGSYADKTREFDNGNKYLQDRYSTKSLKEIDVDGKPQFIAQQDAVGLQPWKDKKVAKDGSGGKNGFQPMNLVNSKTGQRVSGAFDKSTGKSYQVEIDNDGVEKVTQLDSRWVPMLKPDVRTLKDDKGGASLYQVDPNTGRTTMKKRVSGLGDVYSDKNNDVTEAESKSMIKLAEQARKPMLDLQGINSSTAEARRIISDPNASSNELAAAAQIMTKALNKDIMTDKDFARLTGGEYRSYADQFESWSSKRFDGTESSQIKSEMLKTLNAMTSMNERQSRALDKIYLPRKGTAARGRVDSNIGGGYQAPPEQKPVKQEFKLLRPEDIDTLSPEIKRQYLMDYKKYKGL